MLESSILWRAICTSRIGTAISLMKLRNKYLRLFVVLTYTGHGGRGLVWLGHSP